MLTIESKLPSIGVTIFTTMSKLAMDSKAINLSQGFPEFDASPDLIALIEKNMRQHRNQYAPMQGVLELRQKIAEKTVELYQAKINPESEITITSGATEALFAAITATVRQGDEVILFEPAYDSYEPALRLSGGIPVYIRLKYPDYHIDWDEVKAAISDKTRLIVLNSPHNPTGAILKADDMKALTEIVKDSGAFIVSDEVYEHIFFDNNRHESILRYPELAERSFVISSFGKTYHATGWKIGYCIAPEPLMLEFQRIHQYLTFAVHTPTQFAYAEYLEQKNAYLDLPAFYEKKRDIFLEAIKGSRFKPLACEGTYFQMLDYSDISKEGDLEFARWLTVEKGVASIPPSVFYHNRDDYRVLRFCFAKNDDTLLKAGKILKEI
ncbi:aminotransferase class I/II-fold pyridoxal phosphate-dependent enzyme [bacterium]|nr:aminotransferase class I/II-fold pyridoxal phosphate-dependent enzyme [bacterium]